MQCGAVWCIVLQYVAVCYSVLQCANLSARETFGKTSPGAPLGLGCSALYYIAVCCSVLQCAAVCCSVLQCGAACCSVLQSVAGCQSKCA